MSQEDSAFPEYGHGGDLIGSRRMRRSYRFTVAALVVMTGALWFSERFLRHEQTERLYLSALTLETPSARPFLRQAVKLDRERREFPTPKYAFALAECEEDDLTLEAYQQAYKLDPENANLAIRYACRLISKGRLEEAAARLEEAAEHDNLNALPMYLRAAILPWLSEDRELSDSLALVARTNAGNRVFRFPLPLWSSDLPQDGSWYADLCRKMVHESISPLRYYSDYICDCAEEDLASGHLQYWDSWLEKIEVMGARLASHAIPTEPGSSPTAGLVLQAREGVKIQLQALQLRNKIRATQGETIDSNRADRIARLESACASLDKFEENRSQRISQDKQRYIEPLSKASTALSLVFLLYFCSLILSRIFKAGRDTWTIHHKHWGIVLTSIPSVLFLLMVLTCGWYEAASYTRLLYLLTLVLSVMFPLAYAIIAPASSSVVAKGRCENEDPTTVLARVRRQRRACAMVLLRRSYGISLGLFLLGASAWTLIHRFATGLYPWQLKLLTTGLVEEELALVRSMLSVLN